MNRREFLKLSTMAAAATPIVSAFGASKSEATKPAAGSALFRVKPYVQLFDEDSVCITWMTSEKTTGYVTWNQDRFSSAGQRAWDETDGLLDANFFVHRATIVGIDPKKPLLYRVHSRPFEKFGPYGVKYSAPEETFYGEIKELLPKNGVVSWGMLNDVHERTSIIKRFIPHMKDLNGFCCMNGDIMNYVESENGVVGCITKPFSWVTQEAHLPVWYLRGNHETRGCFARNLRDYLALKDGRYYGAATLGGVRFAFLDSGEDKSDRNGQYSGLVAFDRYIEAQNKWLEREVASPAWKKAQARVVFRHIPFPLRPTDSKGGWKHKLPRLTDMDKILQGANVSLGMSAHIHFAEWYLPIPERPYHLITGGGPDLNDAYLTKCFFYNRKLKIVQIDEKGKKSFDRMISV